MYISNEEYTETRLQELRSRILSRVRKPCTGRFDASWDVEQEFTNAVRRFNFIADELCLSASTDVDKYYFMALKDEVEWAEQTVRNAWRRQDEWIEKSKNLPPTKAPKTLPESQTTLM